MDLAFFSALDRDLLLPLADLDRGFTRPSFAGQVLLSYYHAGRVVTYLVDTYGFDAVAETLRRLRQGDDDEDALAAATGVPVEELDRRFREAERDRARSIRGVLDGMPDVLASESADVTRESVAEAGGSYFERLQEGARALAENDLERAERSYSEALTAYEDYVGPGNAYEGLAAVYRAREDQDRLAAVLERYLDRAEHASGAARELAEIRLQSGSPEEAADLFERVLHVEPYDADVQRRLADTYESIGAYRSAVVPRRAVVALGPADRAGAYFDLARVLFRIRRTDEARRAVLQALEIAPDFRDAQQLLLQIVE